MGIMTRLIRLFKADIHGVMDQLEDKQLLLKQYLRDMEEALHQKQARLNNMLISRQQASKKCDNYKLEIEKLEQDLAVAIKKDKDMIARMLIKKLKPLTRLRDDVESHIEALDQETNYFKDNIARQRIQYEQLKHSASAYFRKTEQKEWERTAPAFILDGISQELSEEEVDLELLQRKEALSSQIS